MPPLDGGGFNSFILGLMATACSIFAFQFDAKAECLYLFLIAASDLLEAWQASQMTHHISLSHMYLGGFNHKTGVEYTYFSFFAISSTRRLWRHIMQRAAQLVDGLAEHGMS
jgi:hypothetical protein